MALPLGLGLLGLLGIGHGIKRQFQANDRETFQQGFLESLGQAPSIFDPQPDDFEGEAQRQNIPGTGLLADPSNEANQLQFAANMFGLPGGQQLGEDATNRVLARGGQREDLATTIAGQMERTRFDGQVKAQIANDKLLSDEYFKSAELVDKHLQRTSAGIPSDPDKRRVVTGPGALEFVDVPKPFTPSWNLAFLKNKKQEGLVRDMDAYAELFQDTGRFETGRRSGELNALHTRILLAFKEQAGLGVLSESDYEILLKLIPEPESFTSIIEMGARMPALLGGINESRRWAQRLLGELNQSTKHWGIGSSLADQTPSQAADAEQLRIREERAKELGGTIVPEDTLGPERKAIPFNPDFKFEDIGSEGA